jgi:hypothetical protein
MAFADGIDMAIMLKHDIERMIDRNVPIHAFTDSLSLFDVITRSTSTTEKRLMIDVTAAKEAYHEGTIDIIGFVRTTFNPADAFTKLSGLSNIRLETIRPGVSRYCTQPKHISIISMISWTITLENITLMINWNNYVITVPQYSDYLNWNGA